MLMVKMWSRPTLRGGFGFGGSTANEFVNRGHADGEPEGPRPGRYRSKAASERDGITVLRQRRLSPVRSALTDIAATVRPVIPRSPGTCCNGFS